MKTLLQTLSQTLALVSTVALMALAAPAEATERVDEANALMAGGEFLAAVEVLEDFLKSHPGDAWAFNSLGTARMGQGQTRAAIRAWLRAVEVDPSYVSPLVNLGRLSVELGEPAAALGYYDLVLDADSTHAEANSVKGRMLSVAGRPMEAILFLEIATHASPEGLPAQIELGRALVATGQYRAAVDRLNRALETHPGNLALRYQLGVAYVNAEKYPAARRELRAVVKTSGNSGRTAEGFYHLALIAEELEGGAEASELYNRALKFRPGHTPSLNNLGLIAVQAGEYDSAITYYERARRVEPDSSMLALNLFVAHTRARHARAARSFFSQLQSLPAGHPHRRQAEAFSAAYSETK